MADIFSWAATALTIAAALMTAANLGSRVTGWGFVVFTAGALCWIGVGALTSQPALLWTNGALLFVDLFGVWRWLGRQAKVEEGAQAAAQASEASLGENLFPVSMLTQAPMFADGRPVGHCVDAMAGCGSGKLSYVVISEGGVAGVGETLRRVPWSQAEVRGDRLMTNAELDRLEQLARDQWPAR